MGLPRRFPLRLLAAVPLLRKGGFGGTFSLTGVLRCDTMSVKLA